MYRYYSLGPAAIDWLPDGTPVSSDIGGGGAGGGGKGKGAEEPEGSSWTWFYPYSYAPLMQVGFGLGGGPVGLNKFQPAWTHSPPFHHPHIKPAHSAPHPNPLTPQTPRT